jgi:hypothetical protein
MPRSSSGDVKFTTLHGPECAPMESRLQSGVLEVFSEAEVVELVNRAIYQLEYQAASHRKRGQAERARMKALKEALGKTAAKATQIASELKGDKP